MVILEELYENNIGPPTTTLTVSTNGCTQYVFIFWEREFLRISRGKTSPFRDKGRHTN